MEKEVRTTLWIEDGAVRLEAFLEDFAGTVEEWKIAFYEVWRYQMTYDFAYSIRVGEKSDNSVYMSLLVKGKYRKDARHLIERLGCKNIRESEEHIGIVQTYEIDDCDLFEVIAD